MKVAIAVLIAAAASAPAQTSGDAVTLLQQVAQAAQSTASWRAEGQIVTETRAEFSAVSATEPFKAFIRGQQELRYETSGPNATIVVSNGSTVWRYASASNSYTRQDGLRGFWPSEVLAWKAFPAMLRNAAIVGRDQVEFDGQTAECELVRGELPPSGRGNDAPSGTRTLCIDRARLLVLRDQTEYGSTPNGGATEHITRTISYSRVERNAPLEASLFEFQPPNGATERTIPVAALQPVLGAGVYRAGGGVSAPRVIEKTQPTYSEEARAARLQGTVLLVVEVGPDGYAHNIQVQRSLGLGLDERAMEAVGNWRFAPGTKDGQPVTVVVMIEINFRLLNPPQR
ncbi:MAG: TonB family protein [Bryobacteraceae bacterium]|jgi:TonB family protein